jgi:hypothetical protein
MLELLLLVQLACDVLELCFEFGSKIWHNAMYRVFDRFANVTILEMIEKVAYGFSEEKVFV